MLISQRNSLNDNTLRMICMEKILFITDAENQQKFSNKELFVGVFMVDTEFHTINSFSELSFSAYSTKSNKFSICKIFGISPIIL